MIKDKIFIIDNCHKCGRDIQSNEIYYDKAEMILCQKCYGKEVHKDEEHHK